VRIPCPERTALATATAAAKLPATPEAIADQFVHALGARHWETMVGLMHPAALHELRMMLAPLTESPSLDKERLQLLGVRSLMQAQALSDSAFSVAFLSRALSAKPELLDFIRDSRIEIIGQLSEGPDTVHVVYRMTYQKGEVAVSKMDVFSLRRMGNTWRGLLSMDLRMLGAMLRREARS
jgi:hypothetical protein